LRRSLCQKRNDKPTFARESSFGKWIIAAADRQDNTRYAFLQMDDRVLVYRGADQPDMSVINPESDVWQHIKVSWNGSSDDCSSCADTGCLYCDELADPLRVHIKRREAHRRGRKAGFDALLDCLWPVEALRG